MLEPDIKKWIEKQTNEKLKTFCDELLTVWPWVE